MAKFQKQIVNPREIPEKGIIITAERIQHWLDTHDQMRAKGLGPIPAPYFHDPSAVPVSTELSQHTSNSKNNAGFWTKLWVAEDGWLMGELDVPLDEDAARIGQTIKGASLYAPAKWEQAGEVWEDAITHIALTNKPVVYDGADFQTALSLAIDDAGDYTPETNTNMSTNIEAALFVLAELGLELPSDTSESNIVERIVTAGTAVLSHKKMNSKEGDGSVTEMPHGASVKKPSPIAMDQESSLELSTEQKSLVLGAEKMYRDAYRERLKKLVDRRAVSPAKAKQFAESLIDAVSLSFSEDGVRQQNELDAILGAWEDLPDDACLNALAMSGDGLVVHEQPQPQASAEQLRAIAAEVIRNVGLA
jgi:hypothetical protein